MDDDASPGVPEWVVTYGDMMSLLLTFFIMLVSLSDVVAQEKYRAVLDSLQQYVGYRQGPIAPPGKNFPLNSALRQLDAFSLSSFTDDDTGYGGIRTMAVEGKNVHVFRTREGTPAKVGEAVVFAPGETALSQVGQDRLQVIALELAGKPNKIEIRGHASADPLPEGSASANQCVISYERARVVLGYMVQLGIAPDRMRIVAASTTEPLPKTGDWQSQQNDRVEIRILDAFAETFVGPREVVR